MSEQQMDRKTFAFNGGMKRHNVSLLRHSVQHEIRTPIRENFKNTALLVLDTYNIYNISVVYKVC